MERVKDVLLPGEFGILNKLKAISPESFYLWAIATKVMQEDKNDKFLLTIQDAKKKNSSRHKRKAEARNGSRDDSRGAL